MVQMEGDRLPVPFAAWKQHLDHGGIKVNPPFGNTLRLVTHRDVDRADADRLVDTLRLAMTMA
jgi:hypothetical protein